MRSLSRQGAAVLASLHDPNLALRFATHVFLLFGDGRVETVSGEVMKVDRITPMRGMSSGVHLVVKTANGEVSVHLGPQWYLENQDIRIEPKDKVEIKGSRVTIEGQPALIAAEVKKDDQVLKLRDEAGIPMWAGWRRG